MKERRRLAAIVSADVAGYSRLMGRDESGTLSALKARREELIDPLIANHGGRIVKTTGDGLLLEFPSVVDSARCAIAVQEGMARLNADVAEDQRLELRIGINVGDVIIDGDDIHGDGVNVAARLEQASAPGGICLSDRAYHDVRGRVDAGFVDGGSQELKNISEPVRVWLWSGAASATSGERGAASPKPAEQASIAVLPFSVLSEDRGVGFLADGLAEDVTALLARMPGFFVVSRASSFAFRDRDANVPQIARQLGVRYIVEGSVRDASGALRVSSQLTDATTGRVLWSRRFEARRSETLDLQDEIVRNIIAEIEPELTRAEIAVIRRQRPENVDAWGCYRQAVGAVALKGWREEAVAEARQHLAHALDLDAGFGLAHAYLAVLTAVALSTGLIASSEDTRRSAQESAESAITLDEGSSEVLGYAGCALSDLGHHRRGIEILERAVEIDPSNGQAHVALGAAMAVAGQLEAGIARMRHGMRLSPRDQRLAFWRWALGNFLVRTGQLDDALEEARAAARSDPRLHLARLLEAVALAARGEEAPARIALEAARRLCPRLTLEEIAVSHGRFGAKQIARLWEAA